MKPSQKMTMARGTQRGIGDARSAGSIQAPFDSGVAPLERRSRGGTLATAGA
jgi:hypothetical protein